MPDLQPKFVLSTPAKVFTIGSCFARNIELVLADFAIELPTLRFAVDKSEWSFRPNGLLNQYNPGAMSQRIISTLNDEKDSQDTIVEFENGYVDLLLPGGAPVSYDRAVARRNEIDAIYKDLATSSLVIITLGLIECWFDEMTEVYLNRMPPAKVIKKHPERYTFHALDIDTSYSVLDTAIKKMVHVGIERILLTVSPVPIGATFTKVDAVRANSYSKAILRVCAENLTQQYDQVDYFPSFEIVTSGGVEAFQNDNIHVKPNVVNHVTKYMLSNYFSGV